MDLWGVRINRKHMPSLSSQHVQSLWRNCTELASWILSNLQSKVSFKIIPGYSVQYNESEWKKNTIKILCWIFLMNRLIWWSHMENFNDISMSALVNFWRLKAAVLIHYNCMYPEHIWQYWKLLWQSNSFGTTWRWINDDRIFTFGWTIPLTGFYFPSAKAREREKRGEWELCFPSFLSDTWDICSPQEPFTLSSLGISLFLSFSHSLNHLVQKQRNPIDLDLCDLELGGGSYTVLCECAFLYICK